jgi:hypothetical protein
MSKKASLRRSGMPASDLLEEAVRLLRRAPVSTLLLHVVGSVPCLLGALYFLADMNHSAFAAPRLFESSLVLAALYIWMKSWQAVFAAHLHALLLQAEPPRWTAGRILRLVATQAALQPLGLVVRPAALALTAPYLWAAIFFHNVTVLGDGSGPGLRDLCRRAWQQAALWPWQLFLLTKQLFLFGVFVWVNVTVGLVALPASLKILFGVETVFSRHLGGLLNVTFFAATLAGVYLCLDPIRKAAAVLRCFYGSSLRTGEDLEVQFRAITTPLARAAALFTAAWLACSAPNASAEIARPTAPVETAELNRSIDEVLGRREFAWRTPRESKELPQTEETWFQRWKKDFDKMIARWSWSLGRAMSRLFQKIEDWFSGSGGGESSGSGLLSWLGSVRYLAYFLLGAAVLLLLWQIVRVRRRTRAFMAARPIAARPDLTREDVTADQLPEDGWLQMAHELMDRGELRLALRASYLAGLAHLGQRELIHLARHKSNRDYDRELRRRARAQPELVETFDRSLQTFERSWYGEHEVTRETLGAFAQLLTRIRAC